MIIIGDFNTSVKKALFEIDENYREHEGLIVCGTHAPKDGNVYDTLVKLKRARGVGTPTLGICFGLQLMAIEYAQNILNQDSATSQEFGEGDFVVRKMQSLVVGLINGESYWHNYEVVPELYEQMKKDIFHPGYFGVQYHPEYQSSKDKPHPILTKFLDACKVHRNSL